MKSILTLILLFSSISDFANTTIKYDRANNALIVGQSQRVTDGKGNTFNRGIGTYIPLGQQRSGTARRGEPHVYDWNGRVK